MKMFAFIGALAAVQLLVGVEGHGHVKQPPARVLLCHQRKNKNCWNDAENALQNKGRFPNDSPFGDFDGLIASGMMAAFRELDEQGEDRWYKNRMRPGANTWRLPANHLTKDFRYWITKTNWDPNAPLRIVTFENKPFCTDVVNGKVPHEVTHRCNVPNRTGYHVILAEWKIGDSPRTFYNVIDVDFSGNGGGGNGPAVFGPQPLTRYHDRNVGGLRGKKISKWFGKGQLCVSPNASNKNVISPPGCKPNVKENKLRWNPKKPAPPQGKPQKKCPDYHQGHGLCKGAEGCCDGGNGCFAYNYATSVCLSTCPAGWDCSKGSSCQVYSGYHLCKGNKGCCPSGTNCFAYNNQVSVCMASCPKGWACDNTRR